MKEKKWPPTILGKKDTLDYIAKNNCSIGRYGDGEVSLMAMIGIGFQRPSWKLRKDLIEVSKSNDPSFLVCIPRTIIDDSELRDSSKQWWKSNLRLMGYFWRRYFSTGYLFGAAEITRPWMGTQNKEISKMCFDLLQSIWKDRDLVLIEGEKSRVGVGNDLFAETRSVQRILGPTTDAYSKINIILTEALKQPKDKLFLLALGPTATVLAYRLHQAGYQAIDIGHIDIEYEWYKMEAQEKVPIRNKYVNEAGGAKTLYEDGNIESDYFGQIIFTTEI